MTTGRLGRNAPLAVLRAAQLARPAQLAQLHFSLSPPVYALLQSPSTSLVCFNYKAKSVVGNTPMTCCVLYALFVQQHILPSPSRHARLEDLYEREKELYTLPSFPSHLSLHRQVSVLCFLSSEI